MGVSASNPSRGLALSCSTAPPSTSSTSHLLHTQHHSNRKQHSNAESNQSLLFVALDCVDATSVRVVVGKWAGRQRAIRLDPGTL